MRRPARQVSRPARQVSRPARQVSRLVRQPLSEGTDAGEFRGLPTEAISRYITELPSPPPARRGRHGRSDDGISVRLETPAVRPLPAGLRRVGDRVPVGVLSVVLAGQWLLPGGWDRLGWVPVAVGLLLGLPHGAVDHLVPRWVQAQHRSLPACAGLLAGYLLAAVVMFAALRTAPRAGLLVFLVLSVLHFGTGELGYRRLRSSRPAAGPTERAWPANLLNWRTVACGTLAWGGTPVLLPLTVWPTRTGPLLDVLAPGVSAALGPGRRDAVTAVVLLAAASWIAAAGLQQNLREAAELTLLVGVFLLVPPLVAFAAYFGGWHSLRHLVRLLATDPANADALAAGRLAPPVRRFARQAAAPTAVALLALAVLVGTGRHGQTLLTADLTLLAALTVPHMLTVAWLDRHAGRWSTGRAAAGGASGSGSW